MQTQQQFIGGSWRAGAQTLPIINPSDGQEVGRIARGTAADVDAAVRAGLAAVEGEWGRTDAAARGRLLLRMAEFIRRDAESLAKLESLDVGKPLSQARTDVTVCARYFEYYAGAADKVHGETIPFQDGFTVMTVWEPHGVTAHILPWNYPLQMTGRSIAPALAMGNAIVVKPAEDTSLGWRRRRGFQPASSMSSPGWARKPGQRYARIPVSATSASPDRPRSARWCRPPPPSARFR
jgi:aldehyde dehydrogenase (NAD+)